MFKILDVNETRGHLAEQPGLRGHSHDPNEDLMKQFVVCVKGYGWLWIKSFHTESEAIDFALLNVDLDQETKIIDQFNNNQKVWG